jgi:hypothetical protein
MDYAIFENGRNEICPSQNFKLTEDIKKLRNPKELRSFSKNCPHKDSNLEPND